MMMEANFVQTVVIHYLKAYLMVHWNQVKDDIMDSAVRTIRDALMTDNQ